MCINIFKKWKKQCVPHLIPPPKQFIIIHWWCTKLIPQDPILFTLPFSLQIRFSFWKWTFMLHLLSFEINPYIIHYESAQKRGLHNSHPQLRLKNSATIVVSNALSLKSCTMAEGHGFYIEKEGVTLSHLGFALVDEWCLFGWKTFFHKCCIMKALIE
jgi:hypothetical protein